LTSGYYLEGNGQRERSNQTLEQYLHIYCNYQQDNWVDLETTLRAKPKELPHGTLRRNRIGDLRAKTQRELEWRASGCWIAAVYILHYTCPMRGYP